MYCLLYMYRQKQSVLQFNECPTMLLWDTGSLECCFYSVLCFLTCYTVPYQSNIKNMGQLNAGG